MDDYFVVDGIKFVREVPIPPPPVTRWGWLKPDQFYGKIRDSAPAPAVVRFRNLENAYSHSVLLTRPWQEFLFDLLSLSEYGVHYWVFDKRSPEFADLNRAFEGTYGDYVAFCNPTTGYPGARNWVAGTGLDLKDPTFDIIRGCATNSYSVKPVTNSRGQLLYKIESFDWYAGPPTNYGPEILQDPRVQAATIIGTGGAVYKFPRLSRDVFTALITKEPIYLEPMYLEIYTGERRPLYYRPALIGAVYNVARWMLAKAGLR